MERADMSLAAGLPEGAPSGKPTAHLCLYVARSTPNVSRAESNLSTVLHALAGKHPAPSLQIIDVFAHPKRAIIDGVIVTPTLIGTSTGKRFLLMGDLADLLHLERVIVDLLTG